ncbi:MAG TPA: ester cyclase [Streptosporangiaceae bacterium]|nr:ester cyclase [Streptosporangiaceae bacterium]
MARDENLAVQARCGELLQAREFDRLGEVFAADVVDHDPSLNQLPGVEGVKQFWKGFHSSFPDYDLKVDAVSADDDYATIVYRISGTHRGDYMGVPPTGRHFDVRGIQLGRFVNGMFVERWGSSDGMGILTQLGIVAPLPQG